MYKTDTSVIGVFPLDADDLEAKFSLQASVSSPVQWRQLSPPSSEH